MSAIPLEFDQEFRETYLAEQHSYLQSSIHVLEDLRDRLKQMQMTHKPIRGAELSPTEQPLQQFCFSQFDKKGVSYCISHYSRKAETPTY